LGVVHAGGEVGELDVIGVREVHEDEGVLEVATGEFGFLLVGEAGLLDFVVELGQGGEDFLDEGAGGGVVGLIGQGDNDPEVFVEDDFDGVPVVIGEDGGFGELLEEGFGAEASEFWGPRIVHGIDRMILAGETILQIRERGKGEGGLGGSGAPKL
jgi:hypothetical protein